MTQTAFSWRPIGIVLAILILLVAGTATLNAQIEASAGDSPTLSGELTDMGFAAGGEVTVTASSPDDIIAAGGTIRFEGASADHIVAAGGDISLSDIDASDVILTGGNVELASGTITDDVIAFAGNIQIDEDMTIGGSAMLNGGNIEIGAPIGGELRASGGNISLTANVTGDAYLTGGTVTIGEGVVISGDLTWAAEEFILSPGASVTGEIIEEELEKKPSAFSPEAIIAALFGAILFLAGLGLLILIIAALFPGLMTRSSAMIAEKPLTSLGIGVLVVVVMPLMGLAFMISIIGISAGFVMLALICALVPFAYAAVLYHAGMWLRGRLGNDAQPYIVSRIVWTALAGIILLVIGIIPFLGMLVWVVALLFGMGAVITRGGAALADG
ncbi:DUF4097 domain-containing protein [Parvularcula flava]|uniref:DUF4097 domain-containing protein n=1 Tax=Aquisalinus luteolus TaxID=1566827 RepID=A0A8J3A7S9_9PROT|nr:hypothetical protein [Aquisalinus luteolus]NHK28536.1 DUF4097 domain-containing protein [Aquisalinus luteolus]GGH98772.1 hypothetical protein GCM10011355_23150 [Aquisalinus luteolus]